MNSWEPVEQDGQPHIVVERLIVPGGWIYKTSTSHSMSTSFVPQAAGTASNSEGSASVLAMISAAANDASNERDRSRSVIH